MVGVSAMVATLRNQNAHSLNADISGSTEAGKGRRCAAPYINQVWRSVQLLGGLNGQQ